MALPFGRFPQQLATSPPSSISIVFRRRLLQSNVADVCSCGTSDHVARKSVIAKLQPRDGTVLIPRTRHFAESWAVQTETLGRRVLRASWREEMRIHLDALA